MVSFATGCAIDERRACSGMATFQDPRGSFAPLSRKPYDRHCASIGPLQIDNLEAFE